MKERIKVIQRQLGCGVDGIIGNQTLSAIEAKLGIGNFSPKLFAIDVGHADGTGARRHGKEEHALSLVIARHLKEQLDKEGISSSVVDFPSSSNSDDLNKTIKEANSGKYWGGISLHCDASDNASAKGAHLCYKTSTQKELALPIAQSLCPTMTGRAETLKERTNLGVLNQIQIPWALAEMGFITNLDDVQVLANQPQLIASLLAKGIKAYALKKGII